MKILKPLLFICLFLFSTSCGKDYSRELSRQDDFSGQELFESIFFMRGEAAKQIASYEKTIELLGEHLNSPDYIRLVGLIVDQVIESNSNYFVEFKNAITSGDHYLIQETINDGEKVIENAVRLIPELKQGIDLATFIASDLQKSDFYNDKGEFDKIKYEQYVNLKIEEYKRIKRLQSNQQGNQRVSGLALICAQAIAVVLYNAVAITWYFSIGIAQDVAIANSNPLEVSSNPSVSASDYLDNEGGGDSMLEDYHTKQGGKRLKKDLLVELIVKNFTKEDRMRIEGN